MPMTKMAFIILVSLITFLLTLSGLIRADLLGLLGGIFIVVGIAEGFLFMGTGREKEWFGIKLIILGIILFIILFILYPMIPWLNP
ncbi:MAG: hypothetical protein JW754_04675 [Candidatus Aenigmarchaeota archaeon]|nr:hypothetical protein [Candidatus Aenigmarchaeota archaeon]